MADKLKILFFTNNYSAGGGSERVLTILANNLPPNWDVSILEVEAFNTKKEETRDDIKILPYLLWHGCRTRFNGFLLKILHYHPEIIKTLRHLYDYDVVVGWMAIPGISILPAFPECKTIAWFHNRIDYVNYVQFTAGQDILSHLKNSLTKRWFDILKIACESADDLVTVSKMHKDSILGVYPEYQKKTCVIYNGTDIEELQKMSSEKIADPELAKLYTKLVQESPVLVCVGRICKRKNFALAVRSLAILRQKNINCNLIIIGNALSSEEVKESKELNDVIGECNVQNNVFLFGYQQNPLPFIARAKLLLMTSLDEAFPTVVTEAMTLGVPFVTTPVEGASDELSNNETCGLVSDWNADEYAQKIEVLLKDEKLYQTMSKNCKEHVKRYSVQNYVGSLQRLIAEIPKKDKPKEKKMNIAVAILLFIFYSAFYSTYNASTMYVIKARLGYLKLHFNLLNFVKLCYRVSVYGISILCFPAILIYCSVLVVIYRKRLFGKK